MNIKEMTNAELKMLQVDICDELTCREEKRKKELWGNVIATYKKWVKEFGSIETYDGLDVCLDEEEPGKANVINW